MSSTPKFFWWAQKTDCIGKHLISSCLKTWFLHSNLASRFIEVVALKSLKWLFVDTLFECVLWTVWRLSGWYSLKRHSYLHLPTSTNYIYSSKEAAREQKSVVSFSLPLLELFLAQSLPFSMVGFGCLNRKVLLPWFSLWGRGMVEGEGVPGETENKVIYRNVRRRDLNQNHFTAVVTNECLNHYTLGASVLLHCGHLLF